uniref:Uncharacterized protein n=1 Tax=Octopus bimaculoides TaxID=37653 RepID=A0A0L8H6B8_OCTBM
MDSRRMALLRACYHLLLMMVPHNALCTNSLIRVRKATQVKIDLFIFQYPGTCL